VQAAISNSVYPENRVEPKGNRIFARQAIHKKGMAACPQKKQNQINQ